MIDHNACTENISINEGKLFGKMRKNYSDVIFI